MKSAAVQSRPAISVIIVNFNAGARLRKCLDALAAQNRRADEVIVIDNGSSDDSLNAARNEPGVKIIEAGENLGFAAANNRAVRQATGDWLAFLNPDAYPFVNWLEEIDAAIERYPHVDAFGSLQIDAKYPDRLDGAGDVFHGSGALYRGHYGWPTDDAPPDGECFSPCAAAAVYRKSVFESLAGFEESFFCYCEDVDLGYRLRLAGGRAVQLRDARVLHEGSAITRRHSDFSIYHGHRNRIWTFVRNTPAPVLFAAVPYNIIFSTIAAARCIMSGNAVAYLCALKDAIVGLRPHLKARRQIQANRAVSARSIFSALTWSPLSLLRRRAGLRHLPSPDATERVDD